MITLSLGGKRSPILNEHACALYADIFYVIFFLQVDVLSELEALYEEKKSIAEQLEESQLRAHAAEADLLHANSVLAACLRTSVEEDSDS